MAPYNQKIPKGPFTTLVADAPWPYKDKLPGPGRGAAKHYDTMSLDDIQAMCRPLLGGVYCQGCGYGGTDGEVEFGCDGAEVERVPGAVADNAHLYLWAPSAFVHDAWEIAQAWGFEPKTLLTWVKVTKDSIAPFQSYSTGPIKVRMGMGRSFRNCTEHVVVAVRGKLPCLSKATPNVFFAPRRGHSEKPDIFYDIVESMSPGPYLELFAGRERPGWTCLVPPEGD